MKLSGVTSQVVDFSIYAKRKEECFEINTGNGEKVYEFVGVQNGNCTSQSIALVEIAKNGASLAHFHRERDESYIIVEGEGRLILNGQTKIVKPGDVTHIPRGLVHQIFNDNAETLKLWCNCAPAWVPEDFHIA